MRRIARRIAVGPRFASACSGSGHTARVIRQAFEEQTLGAHAERLVANVFVECRSNPAASELLARGQVIEIAKRQLRIVQHDGEPLHLPGRVFRDVQHRAKPSVERVAKPLAELMNVLRRRPAKCSKKIFVTSSIAVRLMREDVFVDATNAEQCWMPADHRLVWHKADDGIDRRYASIWVSG